MGEGTSVTVAAIESLIESSDFSSVFSSISDTFLGFVTFVTSEPLLMFGLTFAAVAGLTGLSFKVVRRLGFKAHR